MHNPLRSERDVFRAVVIIAHRARRGDRPDVAHATRRRAPRSLRRRWDSASASCGAGPRARIPRQAEVSHRDDPVYRVLVLANETVGGRALLAEIENRCKGRNSEILVVVPALTSSPLEHWASDVDGALDEARERLDASLAAMAAAGLEARGHVGDHHEPNSSLEDALRDFPADEVVISTHPPERSQWLERGVVDTGAPGGPAAGHARRRGPGRRGPRAGRRGS